MITLGIFYPTMLLLWIVVFVLFMIRKYNKTNDAIIENFIEKEREANSARRKEIDSSLFFTPDLLALPDGDAESRAYKRVLEAAPREMLRFEQPMTNTELKLAYGPSQIEDIARLEENFQEFLRALIYWAEELRESGINDDALSILEYALALGADFRRGYIIAADIYAERGDSEGLKELAAMAEERRFTDANVKRAVIEYITEKQGAR